MKSGKGRKIEIALKEMTGQGTTPNIFINANHVGGNPQLMIAMQSNKLVELLKSKQ